MLPRPPPLSAALSIYAGKDEEERLGGGPPAHRRGASSRRHGGGGAAESVPHATESDVPVRHGADYGGPGGSHGSAECAPTVCHRGSTISCCGDRSGNCVSGDDGCSGVPSSTLGRHVGRSWASSYTQYVVSFHLAVEYDTPGGSSAALAEWSYSESVVGWSAVAGELGPFPAQPLQLGRGLLRILPAAMERPASTYWASSGSIIQAKCKCHS